MLGLRAKILDHNVGPIHNGFLCIIPVFCVLFPVTGEDTQDRQIRSVYTKYFNIWVILSFNVVSENKEAI